jgi:hypothetical protein
MDELIVFSLDIEEELWDSTKLCLSSLCSLLAYTKPNRVQRRKEKKEGSKTKKEDWFGESEIMLECRVVFS